MENFTSEYGYADMTLEWRTSIEVYEAKPISYWSNLELREKGKAQLKAYVDGLNAQEGGKAAKQGVMWNPNGVSLPHPFNPQKELVLKTDYSAASGMIYYYERNKPQTVAVPQKETESGREGIIDRLKEFFSTQPDVQRGPSGQPIPERRPVAPGIPGLPMPGGIPVPIIP